MEPHKETKQNMAKYSCSEHERYAIRIKENITSLKHHFFVPWELIGTDDTTNKIK